MQRAKLCVDFDRCEGHGQCVFVAPDLLQLNDDGALEIITAEVSDMLAQAQKAVDACPTSALWLERT